MTRSYLVLAAIMLAAASPAPVYRSFGRWLVACDNTRSCIARGFDEGTSAELDVARDAGPAKAVLTLSAEDPIQAAAVQIDGHALALSAPAWVSKDGVLSTSDPAAVDAFIAAVRNGDTITLDHGPSKDDQPRTVPLAGFTAALLLVDAVQGRPGTPGALITSGGTASVPAAPHLPPAPVWVVPPKLSHAEEERLTKQAGGLHSPFFDPCTVTDPAEVYPLDAAHALAIRPCYLAAYQGSSVVAVLPRGGGAPVPVKLALPGVPDNASDGPDMVDPEFDPAAGLLSTHSKGRGLGDCGSEEEWVWSGGAFRLKALSYQDQCGGTAPGDWPTLYRTNRG